jgi:hypothetical protein
MDLSDVKIYMQGFDVRSIERFKMFFSGKCNNDYQVVQAQSQADIIMLDFDSNIDNVEVVQLRTKFADKPIILISSQVISQKDPLIFSVKKPLTNSFYNLLQQVTLVTQKNTSPALELREALLNHIQSHINTASTKIDKISQIKIDSTSFTQTDKVRLSTLVGRQSDIDTENPQAIMRVLYDPKKLLLGTIQRGISRATHNKKMIELTNFGHRFIIDPKREKIITFASESVLRPLCLMSSNEISTIKIIKKARADQRFIELTEDPNVEIKEWGWDEFLWIIGLWTARGKLPRDTDLKLPVTLSHWPNFTKLQTFPYALAIAAIMNARPTKLIDIAKKLGIEQRFVFSFYSAANAVGIASNSMRQSDRLFEHQQHSASAKIAKNRLTDNDKSHSVMEKMFAFLTGNNGDTSKATDKKQGVN